VLAVLLVGARLVRRAPTRSSPAAARAAPPMVVR